MSNLVRTAIVDKNGVATTRNKKLMPSVGGKALSGVRPALGGVQSRETIHKIKGKPLKRDSQLSRFLPKTDSSDEADKTVRHPASGRPVEVPDDVLYDFLRKGLDANEAAAFTALGLSPEEMESDERYSDSPFLRNLNKISISNTTYRLERQEALDRLQEAGVSAIIANKVITNGLQDGHFDRALDDEQLVELFSKWKFRGDVARYKRGSVKADDMIEAMLNGDLPFESRNSNLADLEKIEYEVTSAKGDPFYEQLKNNPEYFGGLVSKAASTLQPTYSPLKDLHSIVEAHGEEVFTLKYPEMADIDVYEEQTDPEVKPNSHKAGVEGALYIERAHEIPEERGTYWRRTSSGRISESSGAILVGRTYLRNYDLLALKDMGIPAETAYDYLIEKELRMDQIRVMLEDNINPTLADGIL